MQVVVLDVYLLHSSKLYDYEIWIKTVPDFVRHNSESVKK